MKKFLPIIFGIVFLFFSLFFTPKAWAQTPSLGGIEGQWVSDPEVTFVGKTGARSGQFLDWTLQNYQWLTLVNGQNPLIPFWITIRNIVYAVIALFVLKNLSIKSRIVTTLTLEEPWNSYDTGHTLVEVYKKDHWQVYDLDNNVVFKRGERYLNFLEFVESVKNNDYTIEKIADDAEYAVGGSVKDGYDYSFYFEAILSNEATLRDWYKKVIQVPLIGDDSLTYYFFDEKNRSRVESYASNYKFLASEEFMKRFYGN